MTAAPSSSVRVRRVQIRHTPTGGTVLSGTRWQDGARSMLVRGWLRGCWTYNRERGLYESPGSIGRPAPDPEVVARTVRALTNIGFDVDTTALPQHP